MENVPAKLTINSTQIPHYILRDLMPKLSDTELRVVLIIADQTYGWHKDADAISYSQLKAKTGSSNGSIASALKSLRIKKIIQVLDENENELRSREECRGKTLYYRINATYPKIGDHLSKNRTPKIGDTKETNTKYSFTKVKEGDKSPATKKCFNPEGSHKNCVDNIEFLDEKYDKHLIANPKNFKYLEALYKAGATDAVIDRIVSKFAKDPFYTEKGWDLKNVFDQYTKGGLNVATRS